MPEYLDFELKIGLGQGRDYPVAVLRSPAGEAHATMRFPFDTIQLESRLKDLQIALLRSGGKRRLALSKEQQDVRDFGLALFDALMTGEVRSLYDVSKNKAGSKGLRIKLRIADPALAALPWEFLYDSRQRDFVCLSTNTPLVRYLELPSPPQPLLVEPPLRVLGMIASPTDLQGLDVAQEKDRVERALAGLRADGHVELHWLPGQTWRDLQRTLRRGPWHVFHFVGHGAFDTNADEGMVMLCDDQGKARSLRASQLGRFLASHRSLRLAVLNACEGASGSDQDIFSSTASILVNAGLPAVLAMQYEITDRAAIELSRVFYEAIADGLPVDAAVAEARIAVSVAVNNTVEWGTPVLYMRAPDGVLFELGDAMRPAKPQSQPEMLVAELLAGPKHSVRQFSTELSDTLTITAPLQFDLLRVPAGYFLMGTTSESIADFVKRFEDQQQRFEREVEQHNVYVPEYYIAVAPVTVAQFRAFFEATGYRTTAEREGFGWAIGQNGLERVSGATWRHPFGPESDVLNKDNHPVTQVSWQDAHDFCLWAQVRLPSEAEWEKAARGPDGLTFPWGSQIPNSALCNFGMNVNDTTPVGSYPKGASPYGVLDMAGNVWEWTSSLYKDYPYNVADGREDQGASGTRVLRGGCFGSNAGFVRCASRRHNSPEQRYSIFGFRVCLSSGLNTPG